MKLLGIYSLETRRVRSDLIKTNTILTGRERIDSCKFLEQTGTTSGLRGHSLKLYKQRCCNVRLCFFSSRVINSWNRLPQDVVEATSVNMFNKKLSCRREAARCFIFVLSQLQHTAQFFITSYCSFRFNSAKIILNSVLLSPIVSGGVRPKLPGQTPIGLNIPLVFCRSWVVWGQYAADRRQWNSLPTLTKLEQYFWQLIKFVFQVGLDKTHQKFDAFCLDRLGKPI